MNTQENCIEFEKAVATMDIPEMRKTGNAVNARWFLRNGAIRNRNHKNFDIALKFAMKLM